MNGNPYLWGRNLIANRLYDCPVLYFEPYLMNGKDSYARMQIGDYAALGFVNGRLRPSIYREYDNAVTKGLVDYYTAEEVVEKSTKAIAEDPLVIDTQLKENSQSESENAPLEAIESDQASSELEIK